MPAAPPDFAAFVRRKEQAATAATFETFKTAADYSARFSVERIGTTFTDTLLDGPFFESPVSPAPLPSVNLVFVQSRDGNTEAADPSALGGGETDKHVIYEGLSRVAADAVLAGSKTIGRGNSIFSVWHPELVALRRAFGKPRHPAQIVMTQTGGLPVEGGLMFNVPEVRVVILTTGAGAERLESRVASRPWITMISTGVHSGVRRGMERLRSECRIERISAIGGRSAATALIDAGVIRDLYLTTSPINAGVPHTPLYCGVSPPRRDLVVRKESAAGIVFEHFVVS